MILGGKFRELFSKFIPDFASRHLGTNKIESQSNWAIILLRFQLNASEHETTLRRSVHWQKGPLQILMDDG
jgi:hypothetical protein